MFSESELSTIKRALIIYERLIPGALIGKGFFIDSLTAKTDIYNIVSIESKLCEFRKENENG